jgi:hypothetical protein
MGVTLGPLVYVSHEVTATLPVSWNAANFSAGVMAERQATPQPLAINPRKVSRTAKVYAVFTID